MERVIKLLEQQKEGVEWVVNELKGSEESKQTLAEINQALQLLQTGVSGSRRFNIDFCGNLLAGIEINNNIPFVFGAMNGYGNGINVNDISVTEIINDCH